MSHIKLSWRANKMQDIMQLAKEMMRKPILCIDSSMCPTEVLRVDAFVVKLNLLRGSLGGGARRSMKIIFEEAPSDVVGDDLLRILFATDKKFGDFVHAKLALGVQLRIPKEICGKEVLFPGTTWEMSRGNFYVPAMLSLPGGKWMLRLHNLSRGLKKGNFVAVTSPI